MSQYADLAKILPKYLKIFDEKKHRSIIFTFASCLESTNYDGDDRAELYRTGLGISQSANFELGEMIKYLEKTEETEKTRLKYLL